jgi:hypothetical protein
MESKFLTELEVRACPLEEGIWVLSEDLGYYSALIDKETWVKRGFCMDFASVPRLPWIYSLLGNKAHRESVIHDFDFRIDADPAVTWSQANSRLLESMTIRKKPAYVRYPIYCGVCIGSYGCFHKKYVNDTLIKDCNHVCLNNK